MKKHSKKLEAFAERELVRLAPNLMLANGNCYFLFGRYDLVKLEHEVMVSDRNCRVGTFGNTKSAVAWCIADKLNQINVARQIQQLDQECVRHINDIMIKRAMMTRSKNFEFRDILSVKISNQQRRYKAINTELSKCINLAKYWQYRGFNNETQ